MDKSVVEKMMEPEVYNKNSRGKLILRYCNDIFSAISKPSHPHHHEHRIFTKETLRSILLLLCDETMDVLSGQYEWDTQEGKRAFKILEDYISAKVTKLEQIVYRSTPKVRRKSTRMRIVPVEGKCACILVEVFDFEVEIEEHIEAKMKTIIHQLPRS